MKPINVAKLAGGVVFVAALGVNAAQSFADPSFVLPAETRFALFIAAAMLGGAQLLLPRPGELGREDDPPEPPKSQGEHAL